MSNPIRQGPDWLRRPELQTLLRDLGLEDVQVQAVGHRRSFAGKAWPHVGLVRMVSEGVHPVRWLATFVHELAHIADWRERRGVLEEQLGRPPTRKDGYVLWRMDRTHGRLWRRQFVRLAEAAIAAGLFPGNEPALRELAASGATTSDHIPFDLTADPRVQAEDLRHLEEAHQAQLALGRQHQQYLREELAPGVTVHFQAGRYQGVLTGKLVRVNRQTCTVEVGRVKWRVPPHLLQPGPAALDAPPPEKRPQPQDRWTVGQRVAFRHEGHRFEGRILRVNQKTCTVRTEAAGDWRVSFGLMWKLGEK